MKSASAKPVRNCHICPLNMGDICWEYACPRRQWRNRRCPGFANEALHREFREWQEAPHVKTRRELRQEAFRKRLAVTTIHQKLQRTGNSPDGRSRTASAGSKARAAGRPA